MLCIKNKEKLDLGHKLLYDPYKNILTNFVKLSINPNATDFDPIARVYDGLESIPDELKYYYESLLGITSYYQHSKGGRGKYIEKKISSIVETCSLNIKLSELPLWFQYPGLHRRKGIFTLKGLTTEEKTKLRRIEWDFIGEIDETTDVGSLLIKENNVVLVELKNRVDTGGTSARREIWTKKFKVILDILSRNIPIYQKGDSKFSLIEMLKTFGMNKLEIYIGILFNVEGTPATKQGDKERGFYSSNEEGFKDLKNAIMKEGLNIINENFEKLEITIMTGDFEVKFGALYGDDIPYKLFKKDYSVSDLLILKFDDIWLSQLAAIDERTFLLKFKNNYMTILKNLIRSDWKVRKLYDTLITTEGSEEALIELVKYLRENNLDDFPSTFYPPEKDREEYLADIIQILAASEA